MKKNLIEILRNPDKTYFSFEILPPLKGRNIDNIYKAIDPLMEFNPLNINVTYHQEEIVYKRLKNGLLQKKTIRKRPGTVAISAAIKYHYNNVFVVPHLICGGFTKEETEYALIDLHFLGIKNLLVLRGDPVKGQRRFIPEQNGHSHTVDLIKQIVNLNKGIYLDEDLQNTEATDFTLGVAGYPEKHYEAPNMEFDLEMLKQKIQAGAEYIVTQMFFDNNKFFEFEKHCRQIGINVPIIPGIKPIASFRDLDLLPSVFSIDIPQNLVKEIMKCKTDECVRKVGIEWAVMQSKELISQKVPALHFFTIGKSDNIVEIAKQIF